MSYKALYDILCSVKRHMNARVIFRWHMVRWAGGTYGRTATLLRIPRLYPSYSFLIQTVISTEALAVQSSQLNVTNTTSGPSTVSRNQADCILCRTATWTRSVEATSCTCVLLAWWSMYYQTLVTDVMILKYAVGLNVARDGTQSNTQGVWPCKLPIDSLPLQLLAKSPKLMSDLSKQSHRNFPNAVAG